MTNLLQGKKLLVVNACSPSKAFAFKILHDLGIHIIVLHTTKVEWIESYVHERILADVYDHAHALEKIREHVGQGHTIDGALTIREESVLLTSKITDMLGLIGTPYIINTTLKNKYLLRNTYSKGTKKSSLIQCEEDIAYISKELGYPLVIKPSFGADSSLVMKVNTQQELLDVYQKTVKEIISNQFVKDGLDIIVEQYIDGNEVDIDVLMQNGKVIYSAVTDNDPTDEPFFVEKGFSSPSQLPLNKQNELHAMVSEILMSAGVQNCIAHAEAKYTSTGPEIIEMNMRMGGNQVHGINLHARGVDLICEFAKIALGLECNINQNIQPLNLIKAMNITSEVSGTIQDIIVSPDIEHLDYLVDFFISAKKGDYIKVPPQGFDYLGWFTVSGQNREEIYSRIEYVSSHIKIIVS